MTENVKLLKIVIQWYSDCGEGQIGGEKSQNRRHVDKQGKHMRGSYLE